MNLSVILVPSSMHRALVSWCNQQTSSWTCEACGSIRLSSKSALQVENDVGKIGKIGPHLYMVNFFSLFWVAFWFFPGANCTGENSKSEDTTPWKRKSYVRPAILKALGRQRPGRCFYTEKEAITQWTLVLKISIITRAIPAAGASETGDF